MLEKMKQSTHAEVDAWLAQGNRITQVEQPKTLKKHPYRAFRIKQERKKENAKAKKRCELHFSKIS